MVKSADTSPWKWLIISANPLIHQKYRQEPCRISISSTLSQCLGFGAQPETYGSLVATRPRLEKSLSIGSSTYSWTFGNNLMKFWFNFMNKLTVQLAHIRFKKINSQTLFSVRELPELDLPSGVILCEAPNILTRFRIAAFLFTFRCNLSSKLKCKSSHISVWLD